MEIDEPPKKRKRGDGDNADEDDGTSSQRSAKKQSRPKTSKTSESKKRGKDQAESLAAITQPIDAAAEKEPKKICLRRQSNR